MCLCEKQNSNSKQGLKYIERNKLKATQTLLVGGKAKAQLAALVYENSKQLKTNFHKDMCNTLK